MSDSNHQRVCPKPPWDNIVVLMQNVHPLAREFVLFCISRRGKHWPAIYDEMCRVAGNRLFRGLGYSELNGVGLSLGLDGIEDTAKLVDSVTA